MSGDSSTATTGLLGCGSGRTVTVRIFAFITAGGLRRDKVTQKRYFCCNAACKQTKKITLLVEQNSFN